jgi:hypothetical protein
MVALDGLSCSDLVASAAYYADHATPEELESMQGTLRILQHEITQRIADLKNK